MGPVPRHFERFGDAAHEQGLHCNFFCREIVNLPTVLLHNDTSCSYITTSLLFCIITTMTVLKQQKIVSKRLKSKQLMLLDNNYTCFQTACHSQTEHVVSKRLSHFKTVKCRYKTKQKVVWKRQSL